MPFDYIVRSIISFLGDIYNYLKNKGRQAEQTVSNFVQRYPSPANFVAQRTIPRAREVFQPVRRFVQQNPPPRISKSFLQQAGYGLANLGIRGANLAQRLPGVNPLAYTKFRNPSIDKLLNLSTKFPQPTDRWGKVGRVVGENLPYMAIPAARIPKAIMAAKPAARLLGSSLIRGAETGVFGGGLALGEGKSYKEAGKEALKYAGMGALGNVLLSPKLTWGKQGAVREILQNRASMQIQGRHNKIVNNIIDAITKTKNKNIISNQLAASPYTVDMANAPKILNKLSAASTKREVTNIIQNQINASRATAIRIYRPGTSAGFIKVSGKEPKPGKVSGLSEKVLPVVQPKGRIVPQLVEPATITQKVSKPPISIGTTGGGGPKIPIKTSSLPAMLPDDQNLIKQMTNALRKAKPVRGLQEELYAKARGQKFAKLISAREKMAGEQGFYQELGALKGELPRAEYEPIRQQFNQPSVDRLFNMVKETKNLNEWDKINAQVGLGKILGEKGLGVPTRGEIEKMYKVFGKDFTESLLSMRPFMDKLKEAGMQLYNIPRSMMAGVGDFSATMMQNLMFAYRHPGLTGKNFVNQLKYFANDNFYKTSMAEIGQRPNAELFNRAKISFTDVGPIMQQREEQFMSSWAEKIPGLGRVIKATGRAYTGFLNRMRADVADQLINTKKVLGERADDPRFLESMGLFVNAATGRGNLGQAERIAPILGQGLFSARKLAATVNMIDPRFYLKADPLVRKEALKTWLAFLAGAGTITGMAKLAGADVSPDITSTDFGKMKIGNTRLNLFGQYQQLSVLFGRLFKGYATSSTTGRKMTLGEGYRPLTRLELVGRFFESKEHPTLSLFTGALEGQNQIGDKFDWSTETLRRFVPMMVSDAYDLYKEHGYKGLYGLIPTILGIPVQTYGSQIPNLETTASGKPTIKLKNVPDISEAIVNKITGRQVSNIPQEQWGGIIQQKKLETQTEIEKEKLKEGLKKDAKALDQFEGNIIPFSDGSFGILKDSEIKSFKTQSKAEEFMNGEKFLETDKSIQIIGDKVYRKDNTERGYSIETKISYNADLMETKKTRYKKNDDLKGWLKNADELYTNYEQQLQDPTLDELEKMKIQGKMDDLETEAKKYTGYGGFTKPKKGKKAKKAKVNAKKKAAITKLKAFKIPKFKVPNMAIRKPTARVSRVKVITAAELARGR